MTRSLCCFVLSVGFWLTAAHGQEKPDPKAEELSLRMNLLPVGDFPVSGAVIKNGFPVVVNPPPSELIPTPVFIKQGKKYVPLALTMNSPSEQCLLPSGSEVDVLIGTGEEGKYNTYVKVKLPEVTEDATIFLLRNQQAHDWRKEPFSVTFKNGLESFPLGSVRLINFSSVHLLAKIGDANIALAPKSSKVIANPGGSGANALFPYQVSAKINGADQILTNTAVSYDRNSRMNLVMYDRDGKSEIKIEGDDQPVKVVKYFELPYVAREKPAATPAAAATPAPQ